MKNFTKLLREYEDLTIRVATVYTELEAVIAFGKDIVGEVTYTCTHLRLKRFRGTIDRCVAEPREASNHMLGMWFARMMDIEMEMLDAIEMFSMQVRQAIRRDSSRTEAKVAEAEWNEAAAEARSEEWDRANRFREEQEKEFRERDRERRERERRQVPPMENREIRYNKSVVPQWAIDEVKKVGKKQAIRLFHPDLGGTHDKMVAITAAIDYLASVGGC